VKGILKFNLPEEKGEFRQAQDGSRWESVVWDLDWMLRNRAKHGGDSDMSIDLLRDEIRDLMDAHEVSFNR